MIQPILAVLMELEGRKGLSGEMAKIILVEILIQELRNAVQVRQGRS